MDMYFLHSRDVSHCQGPKEARLFNQRPTTAAITP